MRQINRWSAMIGIATLLLGIGIVVPPGLEVRALTTISQIGSDINGEAAGDNSGSSVAMSADGTRIAIGADRNDDNGINSGQVRIYTWNGTTWTKTGADINGETTGDNSGYSVAMSADGSRIAIGAPSNDNVSGVDSGHVRIYTWNGTDWIQTGADINGEAEGNGSGSSVAMSADGSRIAIGAPFNGGSGSNAGHVRMYTWDGNDWNQTGGDINGETTGDLSGLSVAMSADGSRIAIGAPNNDGNVSDNVGHVRIYTWNGNDWQQTGGDINGEAAGDGSGYSVAMSADGSRIAIGATGNGGNGSNSGQVRIYTWTGTAWIQTGADINGEATGDFSGYAVAMSADGSRIAVGAFYNGSNGVDSGHVRLYTWNGTTWTKTGADINGETIADRSGWSVAMSADGSRIAIGAPHNDNNGNDAGHVRVLGVQDSPDVPTTISQIDSDINGKTVNDQSGYSVAMSADGTRIAIGADRNDDNGINSGQVRIYTWNGTTWTKTGADINGETTGDNSGYSVAMSADGSRIAIGAPYNDGSGDDAGHVRIYTWNGNDWQQTGDDINGEAAYDNSGSSVAMSADGSRIAIGATGNDGYGVNSGHVRIYTWNGNDWQQTGDDINGEAAYDRSGHSVAMSADGSRIAIGARFNDGNGISAGHVRIYTWNGTNWTQTGDDINGKDADDYSGWSVAMSADGTRIAIGAPHNDNVSGLDSGHVRIYTWTGTDWIQTGADINGNEARDKSGHSVAMSADGTRIAIGAPDNDGNGITAGHVRIYTWTGNDWQQTGDDINGEAAYDRSGHSVAMSADGSRIAIGAPDNDGNGITAGHVRIFGVETSPAAPTISSVTAANGSLAVSFTAGADGGSPITNYKYSIDGTNYVVLNPATTTSPFTINGLTNGTTYSVSIKAVNEIGDSAASSAVTGIPVAPAAAAITTTIAAPTTTVAPPAATTTTTVATAVTVAATKKVKKTDSLPETGDNSSMVAMIAILFAMTGLVLTSRRRIRQ